MTLDGNLIEIKVSSRTQCHALANSIVAAYNDGKEVQIAVIGPFPIATAMKGVTIANRQLASQGVMLAIIPCMMTRQLMDKESKQNVPWVVTIMKLKNVLGK